MSIKSIKGSVELPKYTALSLEELTADYLVNYVEYVTVSPVCYGLNVTVVYREGKFVSLQYEYDDAVVKVYQDVALKLFPQECISKGYVVLHAVLTLIDVREIPCTKLDVAGVVRNFLRYGFDRYADKKVIINPFALFVDTVETSITQCWTTIGNLTITGSENKVRANKLIEWLSNKQVSQVIAPQLGFIVKDHSAINAPLLVQYPMLDF